MGVDFLDCQFRIEKAFQLSHRVLDHRKLAAPKSANGTFTSVTGRDMLDWLELTLREEGREVPNDCWPKLQECIAATVNVPVEHVTLDACLIHDLGFG